MSNAIINNTDVTVSMPVNMNLKQMKSALKALGYIVIRGRKAEPTAIDKENGKKIKALRKSLGLTQAEFAKGIHRNASYLSQIECGRVRVSFRTAQSIYEAHRVYPDIKFVGKEMGTNITPIA